MTRFIKGLGAGLLFALVSASATAAPITYGFEGGSLSFGISPDIATATGTFTFETSINEVISSDISVTGTGAAGFDGVYSVVLDTLATFGFEVLRAGSDPLSDLTGAPVFGLTVLSPGLPGGGTLPIFDISIGICSSFNCNSVSGTGFQEGGSAPVGANLVERTTVTPVPEPAAAFLFAVGLAGLAGMTWVRPRRYTPDRSKTSLPNGPDLAV